jgi:PEP-CTERM motif
MRKSFSIVALLFATIAAPNAHADIVVDINLSNVTFSGGSTCPPPFGPSQCTEILSTAFTFDSTLNTFDGIPPAPTATGTGGIGPWSVLSYAVNSNGGGSFTINIGYTNSESDVAHVSLLYPQPISTADVNLSGVIDCASTCDGDELGTSATMPLTSGLVTVSGPLSPTPEPDTFVLMLMGIGGVFMWLVIRKSKDRGRHCIT